MENSNSTFAELAAWFVNGPDAGSDDVMLPTALQRQSLDYSRNSLHLVDAWLHRLHNLAKPDQDLASGRWLPSVLRSGAYVGEVIARESPAICIWVDHADLIKAHPEQVKHFGEHRQLETCAFLTTPDLRVVTPPINKICKFIWDGPEESVWYYAGMILDWLAREPQK